MWIVSGRYYTTALLNVDDGVDCKYRLFVFKSVYSIDVKLFHWG